MWPDGICRVTNTRYTKTIQYQDINYQLSQNEDKTAIFEAWCDFLNYFDSSVQFQLSFVNLSASQETFARSISIPPCGDEFDGIRAEYAGMLQNQLARGNNGLIKTKYLTFGVEADNLRAAKPRLERIETDLLNNFKRLGVVAAPLNGFERLHVMHDILRMDEQEPFRFSWDWLAPSGLSTKDFIAPSSFEFKTGRMFRMGKKLGAISFVQILAPELNDRMLADFLDMESSVLVNLHVQSVDQVNAIKTVKRKITDLDKSKIEEQKPYRAAIRAERKLERANIDALQKKAEIDSPTSNPVSKWQQKQAIKKQYAAAKHNQAAQTTAKAAENTAKAAKKAAEKAEKAGKYVWEHRRGFAIAAAILLMLAFLLNGLSSCSVIMDGVGSGIAASTYPSQDADMLGAEAQYCEMEAELQRYLDTYESTHDYDEYHFDLDTIEHDPYVLISMITALHQGEWTLDEVQGTLQMLFDRQYILTEDVVVETRYRTETDTWTDAEGNTHTDTYQVPYDYYICTVTLENFNLSHVPVYIMSEEQLGMYATYMATLGNRPDLFPGSGYIGKYVEGSYTDYDIPPEALDDEVFAAIIKEAEKYLGYPYVWGGSSPSTSFDCSGFVSWVINHSGWDVGRLGAQGLCNICTPVPSANVKPGDLVFFTGTYDTPGVSHVGIYVGNNMMIHCGDPVSYANLNSSYWQSHFYRYGRLP